MINYKQKYNKMQTSFSVSSNKNVVSFFVSFKLKTLIVKFQNNLFVFV